MRMEVTHCDDPINAFECKKCENQFFLTSTKECQVFPLIKILHCVKYESSNKCQECENKYYLSTEKT